MTGEGTNVIAMFLYPLSIASLSPLTGSSSAVSGFTTFSIPTFSISSGIGLVDTRAETLPPTPSTISGSVISNVPIPSQAPTRQSRHPLATFVEIISDNPTATNWSSNSSSRSFVQ